MVQQLRVRCQQVRTCHLLPYHLTTIINKTMTDNDINERELPSGSKMPPPPKP